MMLVISCDSSDGQVRWTTGYDRCLDESLWSFSPARVEVILSVSVCPCGSRMISKLLCPVLIACPLDHS